MPRQAKATGAREIAPERSLSEQSDLQLLEGIRRASEPHFNELYERYFRRIYSFIHGRVRNHADAEEIAQDTFVSVFRSIENYRGQASLLSWIFGIAKNLANNSIRRSQNQRQKLESVEPDHFIPKPSLGTGSPDEELLMRRYVQIVREQLDSLAEWQRGIFEMRHFENLSIPEIAIRTDRSNDAIRSSLYRIKKMMIDTAELDGGDRTL